ncbi:hypothetical protein D9M68_846260 [compost metagenome]
MLGKPLLDGIERKFARVDQDQAAGRETRQLPAQFAADGAAGAGHEDGLAGDHRLDVLVVDPDGFTAEQVFDVHRAHHVDRDAAAHQFAQARHGEQRGARARGDIHDSLHVGRLGRRNGQDDSGRLEFLQDLHQPVRSPSHPAARQFQAPFGGIVVDQRDHMPFRAPA